LFSQTDILIGAHGAGLTNLVWLKNPATVVELLPYGWYTNLFRYMSSLMGLRYFNYVTSTENHLVTFDKHCKVSLEDCNKYWVINFNNFCCKTFYRQQNLVIDRDTFKMLMIKVIKFEGKKNLERIKFKEKLK